MFSLVEKISISNEIIKECCRAMCDPVLSRILLLAVAQVTREGVRKNFTEVAEHRPGFQRRMAFFYNKNCSVLHHLCIYLCASLHITTPLMQSFN